MKNKPLLTGIITSGSLAGLLALLTSYIIIDYLVTIRFVFIIPPEEWLKPNVNRLAFTFLGSLMLTAYWYMYLRPSKLRVHRILWILLMAYDLGAWIFFLAFTDIFKFEKFSEIIFFTVPQLLSMILYTWGYLLATSEMNQQPDADPDNVEVEPAHPVLQRYFRPGLTSAGIAIVLAFSVMPHIIEYFHNYMSRPEGSFYGSAKYYTSYFLGAGLFIAGCLFIYISRDNKQSQRIAWILCIITSYAFFIPAISDLNIRVLVDGRFMYRLNDLLHPLVVLFLAIRGYCLSDVERSLQNRPADEAPTDEHGLPRRTFYYMGRPKGITSSRLAGVAFLLYIPSIYMIFFAFDRVLEHGGEELFYMLIPLPVFIMVLGYMFMFHSPSKPLKHKGWWVYSFALHLIASLGFMFSLASKEPRGYALVSALVMAFLSFRGITQCQFDDPYERRN
jgi:hypothetical protein